MRILFYATYPTQPIGYGKIGYKLSEYLASLPDIELYYLGISNFKKNSIERTLNPKIKFIDAVEEERKRGDPKEVYGVNIIVKVMKEVQPDIFFIYNDIIVTCRLFNSLIEYKKNPIKPYKVVSYLDIVYKYEKLEYIHHVNRNADLIVTFSDCWRRHFIDLGLPESKLRVLPHGLDESLIFKVDRDLARERLDINKNDFVVLNTNRNSYRKANDLTVNAFLKFYKKQRCDPRIKLFLNSYLNTESGYNLYDVIQTECRKLGLDHEDISSNQILIHGSNAGFVPDSTINDIYNAADVGINTCMGEGFGLCNMEQAALGIPQVVSNVGGLSDIFKDGGSILIDPVVSITCPNHTDGHNGDLEICHPDDFAKGLEYYFSNPDKQKRDGEKIAAHIRKTYQWSNILPCLKIILDDLYQTLDAGGFIDSIPIIPQPSGSNELSELTKYASQCCSILELGSKGFKSTYALIEGLKNNNSKEKLLFCNDAEVCNISEIQRICAESTSKIMFDYRWGDDLKLELKHSYNMIFIDTVHVYGQLIRELNKFSKLVNKYIIINNTTIDSINGEAQRLNLNLWDLSKKTGIPIGELEYGLSYAIDEFVTGNVEWDIEKVYNQGNGMTVLKHV